MKRTSKRILQLTLAFVLAMSAMLIAIPSASARPNYHLSLSMTVDKTTAAPGETVKYVITLTNSNPIPAFGVKFSGTAKLVNAFTPVLTMPAQTLNFGDLMPGQTKSMIYTQVIPSTATDGQFFDNFGSAVGYGLYEYPQKIIQSEEESFPIYSNDASARTTIKVSIPEETTPAGDTDGTLVVTGESDMTVLPVFLGCLLLACGILLIVKRSYKAK